MWDLWDICTLGSFYRASRPSIQEDPSEDFYDAVEVIDIDDHSDLLLNSDDLEKEVDNTEENAPFCSSRGKLETLKYPVSQSHDLASYEGHGRCHKPKSISPREK